jgi:hypothetical protein
MQKVRSCRRRINTNFQFSITLSLRNQKRDGQLTGSLAIAHRLGFFILQHFEKRMDKFSSSFGEGEINLNSLGPFYRDRSGRGWLFSMDTPSFWKCKKSGILCHVDRQGNTCQNYISLHQHHAEILKSSTGSFSLSLSLPLSHPPPSLSLSLSIPLSIYPFST